MLPTLSPRSPRFLLLFGALALSAALGVGGHRASAVEGRAKPELGDLQTATANTEPVKPPPRTIKGVILDPEGNPVSGVVVVGGLPDTGKSNYSVLTTD